MQRKYICSKQDKMKPSLQQKKETFTYSIKIPLRWRDIDMFRHVNNAVYLTYFEQLRIAYFRDALAWDWEKHPVILAQTTVNYRLPIELEDEPEFFVRCSKMGGKSFTLEYFVSICKNGLEMLATTGSSVMVMFDYKQQRSFEIPEVVKQKFRNYEKGPIEENG